jgi:hypothetical protein
MLPLSILPAKIPIAAGSTPRDLTALQASLDALTTKVSDVQAQLETTDSLGSCCLVATWGVMAVGVTPRRCEGILLTEMD